MPSELIETDVAIVGSGFSGLGMAIALRRAGRDDFVVLEKASDLGGTWRDNTYPGCACDVPSHLYSYSFAPNPDWSRAFAGQAEIQDYLRKCAADNGIAVEYNAEVSRARFDESAARWIVATATGREYRARALVFAVGPLHVPAIPALPGAETFAGPQWHSARWRHDVDLTGQRVAVIGTGASAAQFVPEIARTAARVDVYQRTPPWVIPRPQRVFDQHTRDRFRRWPSLHEAYRRRVYWRLESQAIGFIWPRFMAIPELVARRHLRRQIADEALRAKLTPTYRMGCKRVVLSDDYYPALTRDNVDLVTDPIAEVGPAAVTSADGTERPTDVIIYGTGFEVTEAPLRLDLTGAGGRHLQDAWRDGMEAYLGTSVAGFPNLFFLLGPNTGLGHTSVLIMVEAQIGYVMQALKHLDSARTVAVRPERQAAFNADLRRRLPTTVWSSGGCRSWYLDEHGVNRTLWPGSTWRFGQRLRSFHSEDYHLL
jgi:cation diffusion facilitator CzcD-associated flavoprotein CzcO